MIDLVIVSKRHILETQDAMTNTMPFCLIRKGQRSELSGNRRLANLAFKQTSDTVSH